MRFCPSLISTTTGGVLIKNHCFHTIEVTILQGEFNCFAKPESMLPGLVSLIKKRMLCAQALPGNFIMVFTNYYPPRCRCVIQMRTPQSACTGDNDAERLRAVGGKRSISAES